MRQSGRWRAGALAASLAVALAAGCAANEGDEPVGAVRAAVGEPQDGFPSWGERVIFVWTNRARSDPAADLADCSVCAEKDCYSPTAPVEWGHEFGRAARFHSENLARAGCGLQHDSPCTIVSDIGSQYTPGPCNGDPSCACESGSASCGSSGTSASARVGRFTSGYRGENIAAGRSDPVDTFYQWLHEPTDDSSCGFTYENGHRYNILTAGSRLGVGKAPTATIWTQDFGSGGSPDGLVGGVHYPQSGSTIEFRANWYSGSAPDTAQVSVDGTCHAMTLERGTNTNGTYLKAVSGLSGCTRYVFHFTQGGTDIYYPTTGSFGVGCSEDWSSTRPATCGSCTPSCDGRECGGDGCGGSCGSCSGGKTCDTSSGTCACPSGETDCSGTCVDTTTNDSHCGGCGSPCASDESCVDGTCMSDCAPDCSGKECGGDGCGGSCGSCASGESCNSGTCECVPDCSGRECGGDGCGGSCGSCGTDRLCSGGVCECSDSLTACGSECVDTRTDDANCGSCGNACDSAESCVASECTTDVPDGGCVADCTDRECGGDTCGGSCGTCDGARVCGGGGSCLCPDDATLCSGTCVDLRTDDAHCGSCGAACGAGERCVAGSCESGGGDGGVPDGGSGDGGPSVDGGTDRDGGAGAGADRELDGGCGCSAPGAGRSEVPMGLAWVMLVLAIFGLRTRRTQRRPRGAPHRPLDARRSP